MDILSAIQKHYPNFSKGQKKIANYITDHTDKAAFMTAARMGATVGVSESTVVRFAYELGYNGFPERDITGSRSCRRRCGRSSAPSSPRSSASR